MCALLCFQLVASFLQMTWMLHFDCCEAGFHVCKCVDTNVSISTNVAAWWARWVQFLKCLLVTSANYHTEIVYIALQNLVLIQAAAASTCRDFEAMSSGSWARVYSPPSRLSDNCPFFKANGGSHGELFPSPTSLIAAASSKQAVSTPSHNTSIFEFW